MKNILGVWLITIMAIACLLLGLKACTEVDSKESKKESNIHYWIPTEEDIAYQDSMYAIIQHTQHDVDTIKVHINQILDRLDTKQMQ
jgi:hypothetical protein